jgi:2-polyprenyl-6-methoxyphenol hydroxylase-like FAD-dependent oxidoreductase
MAFARFPRHRLAKQQQLGCGRRQRCTSGCRYPHRRGMHVGVVGLGTAGAASAIFLARQGLRVTIFEKTPQEKLSGAGAGIGLQPIGLRVLQRLGLLEPILDHGHRIDRLHARTEHGTTVLDLACAPS